MFCAEFHKFITELFIFRHRTDDMLDLLFLEDMILEITTKIHDIIAS